MPIHCSTCRSTIGLSLLPSSHELDLDSPTGTLFAVSSKISVSVDTANFPAVSAGGSVTSTVPFVFEVDSDFPGFTDAEFLLSVATDKGVFEQSVAVRIGNPSDYPPEILNIAVIGITENAATLVWETGIPADGQVFYGTTTNYSHASQLDPAMRTAHSAALSNLAKGTDYHFQIVCTGTNGLTAYSGDKIFRTRARIYCWSGSTTTQELGTVDAPYKSLQAAAEAAKVSGGEILVAMGVYTSAQTEAVLDLDGSDYDIEISGGYSPDFEHCYPEYFETVIDGQRQRRGIRLDNGASLEINGVTITHGSGEWGGGVHVRKSKFMGSDCVIVDNSSTNGVNNMGGGMFATLGAKLKLFHCNINSNTSEIGAGISVVASGSFLQLSACRIENNTAYLTAGGVDCELTANSLLTNCSIVRNEARYGAGGISVAPGSNIELSNCSVSENTIWEESTAEESGGGGLAVAGSNIATNVIKIRNSIIFNNHALFGADVWIREYGINFIYTDFGYSNIGEIYGSLTSSNNLINAAPLFANAEIDDFHLLYGSPCIDAGDPSYAEGGHDMDGESRPFGPRVDIGADEFADVDADHMADYWEDDEFGSITVSDGLSDRDADTLDDFNEYMNQTDPYNSDTDGDLAEDGWELIYNFDPLDPDMDGDGMWDGWEVQNTLDAFTDDAALDPDDDGSPNINEFKADTDPHDPSSLLKMLGISREWGGILLEWQGGQNAWQWIEYSEDMIDWKTIVGFPPPCPETNSLILLQEDDARGFYRINAER